MEERQRTEYTIRRSKRKTLALVVTKDGAVEIRMPLHAPLSAAQAFYEEKRDWILQKQAQQKALSEKRRAFSIQNGTLLWYLGRQYPVQEEAATTARFDGTAFLVPAAMTPVQRKQEIINLYRTLAAEYLTKRTEFFARQMHTAASQIKIHAANAQWGSCTAQNRIYYAWKLLLAPPDCIDYVVVHELAHTFHHNHSPAFWQTVEQTLSDWAARRAKLRQFQRVLQQQDWTLPPAKG